MLSVSKVVKPGQYCRYSTTELPAGIPTAGPQCQAVVVAASVVHSSDVPGLPDKMKPHGIAYLLRGFRTEAYGDPPRKVDDSIYYKSSDGRAWSLHSKDNPDHHRNILTSTDMNGLIDDWDLPTASKGPLDKYRTKGAYLSFTEPFGKE
jgi:hypothetical protein